MSNTLPHPIYLMPDRDPPHPKVGISSPATANLYNRWVVVLAGGILSRWPCRWPMFLLTLIALQIILSAELRNKFRPTEWHTSAWAIIFLSSPTEMAWPRMVEAPAQGGRDPFDSQRLERRDHKSTKVSRLTQRSVRYIDISIYIYIYISAEWLFDPGMSDGVSFREAWAAE